MALNYSQRPIFSARSLEENLVSPMRIVNGYVAEGMAERGDGGYVWQNHGKRDGEDVVDRSCSPETGSRDIVDLLPSDPFGMEIDISTTFTAITGWLENMEVDYGGYGKNNTGGSKGDYDLFAGLNLIWNSALKFQSFPSNVMVDDKSYTCCLVDPPRDILGQATIGTGQNVEDMVCCNSESTSALAVESSWNDFDCCADDVVDRSPHAALVLSLSYLGPRDLLSVELVCRSLCYTVRTDALLWRNIRIDQPLNDKITDDVLVQLTDRAGGSLHSLSLISCVKITDASLKHVLETNPKLSKLHIPGCTRIAMKPFVEHLKVFNSRKDNAGVKHLRIGGGSTIQHEHFEELKCLLGLGCDKPGSGYKPHYFRREAYLLCDDDLVIDVEMCPRCQNFRLVYDCPSEECQAKGNAVDVCKGCLICIPRCVQCGRCLNNSEYEETFCLELLCSHCSKPLPKCQEKQEIDVGSIQSMPVDGVCLHG